MCAGSWRRQSCGCVNPAPPPTRATRSSLPTLALLRTQQNNASLLDELQQASTNFPALPGPTPLLALENGALAVGPAGTRPDSKEMWTEVSRRLARRDLAPLASVCQLTREVCTMGYFANSPRSSPSDIVQGIRDRPGCSQLKVMPGFKDEASENDDSEDSDDEVEEGAPRTVWAWGDSFAVYQSKKLPGIPELLEILKREASEDLDFPTFIIKYLYAVHQVTPPASPQLETAIRETWGLNIGKRAVEALAAKDEDMVDEVLGKPPVVRCRVCHKPSETGVHPECQRRAIVCTMFPDHPGEVPPLVRPPAPSPHDTSLHQTIARYRQYTYMCNRFLAPTRCPQCGAAGILTATGCPECRPGSSKVSRKRQLE